MTEIFLPNALLRKGLNTSVQNGRNHSWDYAGQELTLKSWNGGELGKGKVLFTWTGHHRNIPEIYFEYNHDPAIRNMDQMQHTLSEIYPHGWGPTVTVVGFIV